MIKSFRDREAERIFNEQRSRKLPSTIQRTALRKLVQLDNAVTVNDLRVPPGNRLEALKGGRKGQHSIRITTSGASALSGPTATPITSRLPIITKASFAAR